MRACLAVALCILMVGCAEEKTTWYRMTSVGGWLERNFEDVVDGWLELHPDQTVVIRYTLSDPSLGDTPIPAAFVGTYTESTNPDGRESITLIFDVPDLFAGAPWTADTIPAIREDSQLSFSGTYGGDVWSGVFVLETGDHPHVIEEHDLVSVNGGSLPSGETVAGWHRRYSDGVGVFALIDEEVSRGDPVRFLFGSGTEMTISEPNEVGIRRVIWGPEDPSTGYLVGDTLGMRMMGGDSLVFHKRR